MFNIIELIFFGLFLLIGVISIITYIKVIIIDLIKIKFQRKKWNNIR